MSEILPEDPNATEAGAAAAEAPVVDAPSSPWSETPPSELFGRLVLFAAVVCGSGTGLVSLLWDADVLTATVRATTAFLTLVLVGRLGRWLLRTLEASVAGAPGAMASDEASTDVEANEREAA